MGQNAEAVGLSREAVAHCREILANNPGAPAETILVHGLKQLIDALEAQGPATKGECDNLRTEAKALLGKLSTKGALDAESQDWMKRLQ